MSAKELVEELESVTVNYNAIAEQHKDKKASEIPAEDATKLTRLRARGVELRGEIEAEQKREAADKDVAGLKSFLEQPAPNLPQPTSVNDDKDGRKALESRGWEFKGHLVYKQTSIGKSVEMYPEDVLFGPLPTKQSEAAYAMQIRATMQPAYETVYRKWLKYSIRARTEGMAFSQLSGSEQKALSEGSDDAGGFLVPPDVQAELLVRTAAKSIMRQYATIQTTSRDTLKWPRVQPASATAGGLAAGGGSIFSSGFVGAWVGETPAFTETDPAFGTFDVPIKKLRVATKLSNDFISDSVVDILAFLSRNGAENMALVEDYGFIAGNGAGLQPNGILNSGASTTDISGTTADTVSNTTSDAGSGPKIATLIYALPSQYLDNARFVTRRATEGQIRALTDFQARPLWPETPFGPTPRSIFGYPLANSEFVDATGTNANRVAIWGDLKSYVIAQRAQISTVVLRERFADTDQTGIIIFERVGGDTWNTDALRIGIV